jgi:hypothetical protein
VLGGDMQFETVGLLAFPFSSQPGVNAQPCDLPRLQQRPVSERIGDGIDAAGKGEGMGQAHPVEGTVGGAFGGC